MRAAKGKLTKFQAGMTGSAFSETKYLSFDILGRVTSSQQIDGMTFGPQRYVYNLSGGLTGQTYRNPTIEDGEIFAAHDAVVGKGCE